MRRAQESMKVTAQIQERMAKERGFVNGEPIGGVKRPRITVNFEYVAYAFRKGYRYCCLEGSSRSGKTWAILQWIVFACLEPKTFLPKYAGESIEVRCLRHDETTARSTIYADLMKILGGLGFVSGVGGFKVNQRDLKVEFPNGSTITFGGASEPGKLHGMGQDIVFFNEAMMISKAAVDQMEMRTRIGFIFDWNPSLNEHWIFKQGFDHTCNYAEDESLAGMPKVLYAHSTYKDNLENLTPGQIASIEQYEMTPGNIERGTANKHMWEVYGLGKRGYMEGRIVTPERITYIPTDEFPSSKQWELHGYGLDFGTTDPCALIECAIWNKKLYVKELVYEKNLQVNPNPTSPEEKSLVGILKQLDIKAHETIVADSARPDIIKGLRQYGYCVLDAYKWGKSDIAAGINLMNSRRWCVTDDSFNVKFELENWVWATDRWGNKTGEPGKKWNHAMDAIRYWLTKFVGNDNGLGTEFAADGSVLVGGRKDQRYACEMDLW